MIDDLVSVIMPAYNAEKYIAESIESVIKQTYENWELIIVDDCSKDNTKKIINSYTLKDDRIKLISLSENNGVANARNVAIKNSKGRYVAFLDSDDLWLENKLEEQISFMKKNKVAFSFTQYKMFSEKSELKEKIIDVADVVNYKKALFGNPIGCLTVCINRSSIKPFTFSLQKHEDYIAWLNIMKDNNICAYGIKKVLALYRTGNSNSLSGNKLKSAVWTWKVYRKSQRLSLLGSYYYISFYIFYGIKKYLR